MSYCDFDPMDIDPETNRPYSNYSTDSLDTGFHDHEMDVDDPEPTLEEEAIEVAEAVAAAFPPTLHRNGAQVAALAKVRALLERSKA